MSSLRSRLVGVARCWSYCTEAVAGAQQCAWGSATQALAHEASALPGFCAKFGAAAGVSRSGKVHLEAFAKRFRPYCTRSGTPAWSLLQHQARGQATHAARAVQTTAVRAAARSGPKEMVEKSTCKLTAGDASSESLHPMLAH